MIHSFSERLVTRVGRFWGTAQLVFNGEVLPLLRGRWARRRR